MKKSLKHIVTSFLLLLIPLFTFASTTFPGVPKVWTVPAVWTGDQQVTFYYDVTAIGFTAGVDLYLWAWQPSEPDAGNGANSSAFAKLTYDGNNIYHITMTPTQYFNVPVSAFEDANWAGMWQELKTQGGEYWTSSFEAPDNRAEWAAFASSTNSYQAYSGKKTTGYTDKFTLDQPMTIVLNPDLFQVGGVSMTTYSQKPGFTRFNLHSGLNDWTYLQGVKAWVPACLAKTNIQKLSNGYYSISMTSPYDFYSWNYDDTGNVASTGLQVDTQIDNLAWLIVGIVNNTWTDTSPNMTIKAGTAIPYPDPVFSIFPTRISAKDILTVIRQWNESNAGVLTYTITAGSKTITGTMDGIRDKRQATIDLISQLSGLTATELHIVITKANGMTAVDTTIPMITPDTVTK